LSTILNNLSESRITVSVYQANLISVSAVLVVALSIPATCLLLYRLAAGCLGLVETVLARNFQPEQDVEPDHNTPLISPATRKRRVPAWRRLSRVWRSSSSLKSLIQNSVTVLRQRPYDCHAAQESRLVKVGRDLLVAIFFFSNVIVFAGFGFVAPQAIKLIMESAVLSNNPDCGYWVRNSSSLGPSPTGHDYLREVEALAYAKKCYHALPGADGCNAFLTQALPYTNSSNQLCPFEPSLCSGGEFSAFTLDTGPVSSKALGINVPVGYSFRRATTCSPIVRRVNVSEDGRDYIYDYGKAAGFGDYTWHSPVKVSDQFAGYDVALVSFSIATPRIISRS
jgi:hypothetical protein